MLVEKNSWKNLIKTLIKYLGICLLIFFIFLLNHEIDKRLNGEWKENSQRIEKTRPEVIIISRKSGQKIPKIANLQYYKSKANYGTKKKGISR